MKKIFTQTVICALLIMSMSARAQDGLFISEIADPGDEYTGRFIELFNAGSEAVDFDTDVFYLSRQSNGGTTWGEVQLTGSVASGATYVIGGSAFESWYGFAPNLVSGILTGNGDDPYSLYESGGHETGMLHDIYGDEDTDGTGEPWEYTDSRAVRVASVDDPRILWSASEWVITPADIADCDPGTHNGSVPQDPRPEPGDFTLQIDSDTVGLGMPLELAVSVSELLTEDDIISYQFDLHYDPSVIEYTGSTLSGTFADGGTLAENNAIPGKVSISYMNTTALIGAGDLLVLQFNSLVMASTDLSMTNVYLNNIPVVNLVEGTVLVAETAPPTAAITYGSEENRLADMLMITATFTEEMAIANPVWLSLSGAAVLNDAVMVRLSDTSYAYLYAIPNTSGTVNVSLGNGTDLWGNEVEAVPTSGATFTIIGLKPGDVNDDGEVQAYDAALTLQHSVGLDPMPEVDALPWENWRDSTANVNGDGAITAYDAGLILQYSAGIITDFTGGTKKAASIADIVVEVLGDRIVLYSYGDLVGLNISIKDSGKHVGHPRILLESSAAMPSASFMTAANISETDYRFGLCTAHSPAEGSAILEIPILEGGSLVLDMVINDMQSSIPVEFVSVRQKLGDEGISIYPNPASERLFIHGSGEGSLARIFNISGQQIITRSLQGSTDEIDISDLKEGIYMIRIEQNDQALVKKFIKK